MNTQAFVAALAMLPGGITTVVALLAAAMVLGGLAFAFAVMVLGD